MYRYIFENVKKDLKKKIVLISGPRQAGKTTLSKMLFKDFEYLNYDYDEDRNRIEKKEWDRKKDLVIFDEIHKMNKWKAWLKGIYDIDGVRPQILVTGSAQLDTLRKVGDSLAGRYFSYRLHPLDLKEIKKYYSEIKNDEAFLRLLNHGGFPEPFFDGTENFYKRWRRTHNDIIIKQDLLSIEKVTNITGIENLVRLMRTRVGSNISYTNLARDLEVDPKTIKSWLDILERLFVIFKVVPYSKKIKNSLLKAPKYYFYDNGQVQGDDGIKLENLVACALLKELHHIQDVTGDDVGLYYLRNKKGEEIDFFITIDNKPIKLIEVKWSDDQLSKNFKAYDVYFSKISKLQLVGKIDREKTLSHDTEIRLASKWLSEIDLKKQ